MLFVLMFGGHAAAWAQNAVPAFGKSFWPDTIGPGSTSMLVFTIDNSDNPSDPVTDLAFTDALPAGTTLAAPASVSNTCHGTVTAPDGGSTVALSDGDVAAGGSCEVVVNVTSGTAGAYINTSGDLTSSAGNSGSASATLTVSTGSPGFTKRFAPSTVEFGGRSTLTFTVDNSDTGKDINTLGINDALPSGMVVADPSNASTDCEGRVTIQADPGSDEVSLSSVYAFDPGTGTLSLPLPKGMSCTFDVDVTGGSVGRLGNISDELNAQSTTSLSVGRAAAVLEVTGFDSPLSLGKEFIDDPAAPGGTTTLEFTVANRSRRDAATGITFTDDLDAVLSGLSPVTPLPSDPCGTGSILSSSGGLLTLSNGSLPAGATCTFDVELNVPAVAAPGTYFNSTSSIEGSVGGEAETGNSAEDLLFVVPYPALSLEFTDDPVGGGGSVTLEYTITNSSSTSAMTDIAFLDELTNSGTGDGESSDGFLPYPVSVSLPPTPDPPCGSGSSLSLSFIDTERQGLSLTGGSLPVGESCTFSVTIDIPEGFAGGTYTNTTGQPTAQVDGTDVTGPAVSDDLVVAGAPRLTKEFTDDPVAPGDDATLVFTLENLDPDNDAIDIAFSDDLDSTLNGLTWDSVGTNGCNGSVGSTGSTFTYTDGNLAAGESCEIDVTVQVPAAVAGGIFTNTTSSLTATVDGVSTTSGAATDDLVVTGLQFSKAFSGDPVIAGDTATLTFTLDNTAGVQNIIGIEFRDDLDGAISDMTATSLPSEPCGSGSSISSLSGGKFLELQSGNVSAGASCTFDVEVRVPSDTPDDDYLNATTSLSALVDGTPVTLPGASDELTVRSALIDLEKSFTDDPVTPGESATLEFTLTNTSPTTSMAGIAFTDDLDAVLSGLTFDAILANDCGAGTVSGMGTGLVSVTGVGLAPSGSCTVRIATSVPPGAPGGESFTNTTSAVTGTAGAGLVVSGAPASDDLETRLVTFTKSFTDGPVAAGESVTLQFTLTNLGAEAATGLAFSDDLETVRPGLEAALPPLPDPPCGADSQVSGTSTITLTGASLAPAGSAGDSCTFSVTVNVPEGTTDGTFVNTTSELFKSGLPVADPATAKLVIETPPLFAKRFDPERILPDGTSTLVFTVNNTASGTEATDLDFTDNLPAGVTIAATPNAATTCTGGVLTATAGTGVAIYTGGSIAAGASCTVSVDVTASATGTYTNTSGELTSSSGNSGTASDNLIVDKDSDGDGIFDGVDDDDDNDGLKDVDDSAPLDPDQDGDQVIDGLDPEPEFFENICIGFGMPTDVTVENLLVPAGQTIVCGVTGSITVEPSIQFESTGSLVLIAPRISLQSGFDVPSDGEFNVISADPTALITP